MKQRGIAPMLWIVALLGMLVGLAACAARTTPPGANMVFGSLLVPEGFGGSYTLLHWNEGLAITLVDDSNGEHQSSGSGSTNDPVWHGRGSFRGQNGHDVTWRVETIDGKSATFFVNEQSYDLAQGTLFLIRTTGNSPQVIQQQGYRNQPCSDDQSCQPLLKQDPAVAQFIRETLQAQ